MTAAAGLLRRLQARFPVGSLRARLVSGAAWSLLGSAASQVVAALTSIYVARLLGKDTFGELAMVRSTVQMFGVFAGLGLGLTVSKCIAECRHRAGTSRQDPGSGERAGLDIRNPCGTRGSSASPPAGA